MKDVTFGVKVPEGLRDEINEMMKHSGLVGREFMQELVDSYLLDKGKADIPEMAEEIKELQLLTHRINEMYLYLGARFKNIIASSEKEREDISKETEEEKESHKEELDKYKGELKNVREEVVKFEKELTTSKEDNKELVKKIEEISGYKENFRELNGQYKNKINELEGNIQSLKHLKEENDSLVKANKALQENNDNLASELWFSKREVEGLKEVQHKNKEDYSNHISRLKEQHLLEKQTQKLEMQLKHQKTIESLSNKTASIQDEYNQKLKELLFNMESKNTESKEEEGEKK